MTEVIMPKMGDGMEEGTLVEWLVQEGGSVKSGDVIGTIQSDKALLELEATAKGTLTGILVNKGETVPVGQPIAAILKEGESLPADWGKSASPRADTPGESPADATAPSAPATKEATSTPAEPKVENQAEPVADPQSIQGSTGRVKASPLARKKAAELGVDLSKIKGSGPGGRIVVEDVKAAPQAPASRPVDELKDQRIELNYLRGLIAERTQHSKQNVPHFYVSLEVDVEKITDIRAMFKAEDAGKISVNDFVVKACVLALKEMPIVNASFMGDYVQQYGDINIGVAAAVEDGLLVPVLHQANNLTIREISDQVRDLVIKARDGKLLPAEMKGSTFSISNMGMLNVDSFSAIINEPNAAIVAIGTAQKKVVVNENDELEVRSKMTITGSFDHRVVDGALGAKFMNIVRDYLENPTRLLS